MSIKPSRILFGIALLAISGSAQVPQDANAARKSYQELMKRKPFLYHTRGRMALARTGTADALAELLRDYANPRAVATMRFPATLVQDWARYTMAVMFARFYGNWTFAERFAKLRSAHRKTGDAWLWINTLAMDGREPATAAALRTARTDEDPLLRAAAIESLARYRRQEVLAVVPEVCAAFPKPKEKALRRAMVAVLSSALLAHRDDLKQPAMQTALRAYLGLLAKKVKLDHSAKMLIARYAAQIIGKDRRYIEPEPWLALLDRGFEPPKRAGSTVTKMRFFGIEAEGDRLCYLVDLSNSMLKPIDPALLRKGPITGRKKKRKRGQLPTEDDIPWHLVKTRFDLARWHLKISMQRLTKDKRFCVVWFGDESGLLKSTPGMIKATRGNVRKVIKELDAIKPGVRPQHIAAEDAPHGWLRGQTNMHGGLRRAFAMHSRGFAKRYEYVDRKALAEGCDTIFLISDGAPSSDDFVVEDKDYKDGKVVAELEYGREVKRPQRIVYHGPMDQPHWLQEEVRRMNVFRKVQVHCVGIGEADISLLRGIAGATEGQVYLFGAKAKSAGRR